MKLPLIAMVQFWLVTCLIFVPTAGNAELKINLSQATQAGLDLTNLETTLETATEMELSLVSNATDFFAGDPDLVSLNSSQAQIACEQNQLLNLKQQTDFYSLYKKKNYLFKNNNDCTVSFATYSMVVAYPLINMVTTRPESPADFFDLERFPGARALPDDPIGTLEWALLAYGIPINEVYQLLSTKRGLKLAFAKLDSIKRHIVWWHNIDELKKLIKDNQVSMATGPHTVFYDLQFNQPMEIVWNGQLLIEMHLGINAASTNIEQATQMLSTLMSDSPQFKLAYEYAIGPTNKQTLNTLELLPQAGQIMVFVPSFAKNRRKAIWMDYHWHQTLDTIITDKFKQWRDQINN